MEQGIESILLAIEPAALRVRLSSLLWRLFYRAFPAEPLPPKDRSEILNPKS